MSLGSGASQLLGLREDEKRAALGEFSNLQLKIQPKVGKASIASGGLREFAVRQITCRRVPSGPLSTI